MMSELHTQEFGRPFSNQYIANYFSVTLPCIVMIPTYGMWMGERGNASTTSVRDVNWSAFAGVQSALLLMGIAPLGLRYTD